MFDEKSSILDVITDPEAMRKLFRDTDGRWFVGSTITTGRVYLPPETNIELEYKANFRAYTLPKLRFTDPTYSADYPNTTVRLGEKWSQIRSSMIMLCDNGYNYISPAEVVGKRLTLLNNVTMGELTLHHRHQGSAEPGSSLSPYVLQMMLREAYGRFIKGNEMVTVLTFQPVTWGALL